MEAAGGRGHALADPGEMLVHVLRVHSIGLISFCPHIQLTSNAILPLQR